MRRSFSVLVLMVAWLSGRSLPHPQAEAQSSFQALTYYAVTVYSGPDRAAHIVGVLMPQAKVILESRNADTTWVLGHSTDGTVRGWLESRFLDFAPGFSLPSLLFSSEMMFVPSEANPASASSSIDLNAYPTIPANLGRAREIYDQGRILGTNLRAVSKIGDCITDNVNFLSGFGRDQYALGGYSYLQSVIDQFADSLAYESLAAYDGLVTSAVLDPIFANPVACLPGETPLRCEYRVHQPAVAVIMFGAQDLLFTPADQFDQNLRRIVHETIQAGVIPLVSTFPGNLELWNQSVRYNQIVVQVALDYQVPLLNLWQALDPLPNHGLNADGRHLSPPITTASDLTSPNLRRGYPMRNLVTLQALDAVWRGAMY